MIESEIPQARHIKSDGSVQLVQPLGYPLREGNTYYNEYIHKGNILCLCCNADMRMQEGAATTGGSSGAGRRATFIPVNGHEEDGLKPLLDEKQAFSPKIDRTKGYRVHINTRGFSSEYNVRSGAYEVSEGGRITITDEDLKSRERVGVKSLKDLMRFFLHAKPARIEDSVFIFGNKALTYTQFVIRSDNTKALADLSNRAKDRAEKSLPPPFCLLRVSTTKDFTVSHWIPHRKLPPAPIDKIPVGQDDRGYKRYVRPGVWINNRSDMGLQWGLREQGDYWIMGLARHNRWEGDRATIDSLNISIDDADQMLRVNIENDRLGLVAKPAESPRAPRPSGP